MSCLIHFTTSEIKLKDGTWVKTPFDSAGIKRGTSAFEVHTPEQLKEAVGRYYHHGLRTNHPNLKELNRSIIGSKAAVVFIDPTVNRIENRPKDGPFHVFVDTAPSQAILGVHELSPKWEAAQIAGLNQLCRPINLREAWGSQIAALMQQYQSLGQLAETQGHLGV